MIPVFQRVLQHAPDRGEYGDCLRACLASLLEVGLDDVPHFADESQYGSDWYLALQEWLAPRDLRYIVYPIEARLLADHCKAMRHYDIDALHLLGGVCGTAPHVVVAQFGICIHDPWPKLDSPFRGHLSPDDNGCFEFGMFVKRFI
jgi:hypothetical protein